MVLFCYSSLVGLVGKVMEEAPTEEISASAKSDCHQSITHRCPCIGVGLDSHSEAQAEVKVYPQRVTTWQQHFMSKKKKKYLCGANTV